jgi:hypothetical protein
MHDPGSEVSLVMAQFNERSRVPPTPTQTHEGGRAVRPANPIAELVLTAASTLAGEDTFYETAETRRKRLADLVHDSVRRDPRQVAQLVTDLRTKYLLRSASIVVAAEYVAAGGPDARKVVAAACQRADEPAEFIAYWRTYRHGLGRAVKSGLADALERLVTPRAALKWNSHERQYRLADVIELTHPVPESSEQDALFHALLNERHYGTWEDNPQKVLRVKQLPDLIRDHLQLAAVPEGSRRQVLHERGPRALARSGFTWERLSSWLPGGMDAEAWEAVIPTMNVMALLRNLRNFDKVGISEAAIDQVIVKITNPIDVRESKILPMRVYQAYVAAPSDNWKRALGKTLEAATPNVPDLPRSLVLIDVSGSMSAPISKRSQLKRMEVAPLLAACLARRSSEVDVAVFSERHGMVPITPGESILSYVKRLVEVNGERSGGYGYHGAPYGHATYGHTAIRQLFDPKCHDRVLLFTDDQQHDSGYVDVSHVPEIVTFQLDGSGTQSTWGRGRYHVGGFSDQIFVAVAELLKLPAGS